MPKAQEKAATAMVTKSRRPVQLLHSSRYCLNPMVKMLRCLAFESAYKICVMKCRCCSISKQARRMPGTLSACNPGCLSVLQAAVRLCCFVSPASSNQTVLVISAGRHSNKGANAFRPCSESQGLLESGASGPAHSPACIESYLLAPTCGQ